MTPEPKETSAESIVKDHTGTGEPTTSQVKPTDGLGNLIDPKNPDSFVVSGPQPANSPKSYWKGSNHKTGSNHFRVMSEKEINKYLNHD